MFSGIRSMIFGYTETSEESSGSISTSDTNVSQSNEKSIINDQTTASVLLEQTLNAATTKFTEQLLPQQASIEQLQSSSHQLLPTLNEQLEEDKLKNELQQSSVVNGDDDDDDCFNADSWEMLDLNEKTAANVSECVDNIDEAREVQADMETINSTVHGGGETSSDSISKSSSGILKLNDSSNSIGKVKNQAQQQQKQHPKPKVSFETPDLVKNKQKIEKPNKNNKTIKNKPKQQEAKCQATSQQKQGKPKGGDNQANVVADTALNQAEPKTTNPSGTADESSKSSLSSWPSMPQQQSRVAASPTVKQPAPALNYSAALSFKPKSAVCKNFVTPLYVTSSTEKVKSSGAVKRNRPLSSSSWSSNDQFENDAADVWDDIKETIEDPRPTGDDDDNESIMSSGFSDCDYGYEGLNDFIMKPKRSAISKRDRNGVSNASLRSMARGSSKCSPSSSSGARSCSSKSTQVAEVPAAQQTLLSKPTKSASKSATKPNQKKKKKLTCSIASKPSDFLKQQQQQQQQQPPKVTKNDQAELMPSPSTRAAGSSNDSSDIADMDESWYVTPPPCFTGANKLANETKVKQPKTKGDELDARENELIEHPSIYIASTSSRAPKVTYTKRPEANEVQVDLEPVVTAAPIVVPKKATKATSTNDDAWENDDDQDSDFDCLPSITLTKNSKNDMVKGAAKQIASRKAEFKLVTKKSSPVEPLRDASISKPIKKEAWKNKFTVDDWNLDDQEDPASDFDDMYETSGRKKRTQVKQSKKRQQGRRGKAAAAPPVEPKPAVVEYDSDVSIDDIGSGCRGPNSSVEVIFNEDDCEPVAASLITEDEQQDAEMQQENKVPGNVSSTTTDTSKTRPSASVKAPVPVKPIEPERKPGWQLKRQRSRRRPLAATTNTNTSGGGNRKQRANRVASGAKGQQMCSSLCSGGEHSSASSSARSTPTLIDRIGSSIVANLTNLTGGFASSPVVMAAARNQSNLLNDQHQQQHQDQQHAVGGGDVGPNAMMAKLAAAASNEQHQLQARKRLSKGSLRRQNVCAMQANSQRRPDRRLRMFATQNGVSVNRKVHTNFH